MENNYVLGDPENPSSLNRNCKDKNNLVPLFEPYVNETCINGVKLIPIKYYVTDETTGEKNIKETNIEVRFSKVKNIFYDKTAFSSSPGSSDMGKYVSKLDHSKSSK